MGILQNGLIAGLVLVAPLMYARAQPARSNGIQQEAWEIVELANQARAANGAGPLHWDPALGEAAREHCLRMAAEGPISHRYGDEPDLTERAGKAGAHFSLIEENVAVGPTPAEIHDEWMHSPGHRTNMLNPDVDRVGVAVVASRGVLYAVADYERGVTAMTATQVEAAVAHLMRGKSVTLLSDPVDARAYCAGNKSTKVGNQPGFRMLWQDSDLSKLPPALLAHLASGQYRQAAVGSCPVQNVEGSFTTYRVAVLLY
jgi:hypothetical protein